MLVINQPYEIVTSLSVSFSLHSCILAFQMICASLHKLDQFIIRGPLWHTEEKLHPKILKPPKCRIVLP